MYENLSRHLAECGNLAMVSIKDGLHGLLSYEVSDRGASWHRALGELASCAAIEASRHYYVKVIRSG